MIFYRDRKYINTRPSTGGGIFLRKRTPNNYPVLLWIAILLFLAVVLTFPKWITIFYPLPHSDIVIANAAEYEVDPYLVFAIIRAESKYETGAESVRGAKGLMQIMPETASWIAAQMDVKDFKVDDLHDPATNIRFGCWYLHSLLKEYHNNIPFTIAAYNAGQGEVQQWIAAGLWDGNPQNLEGIPFPETRQYVRNVLKNHEAYLAIYK
jgi:soluble lytic murein transglycosylase